MSSSPSSSRTKPSGGSVVLIIAFLKARLIGIRFMELHEAVLALRIAFEAWVVIVCAVLLVLFGMEP